MDCSASKPADARKKNASADSSALTLVSIATCLADLPIAICCSSVVFIMARDWLSLSSNSMNSLVALAKALTRTVPTAIAPTLATVPNLFNFPDESSVDLPK